MNFIYKFVDISDKKNCDKLEKFLLNINNDYPVPLTNKISFHDFILKISNNGLIIGAFLDDAIVGGIFFYANNFSDKIAFLTLIGVQKEYRCMGIANNLLIEMKNYCQKKSFSRIQLYTHKENKIARRFYEQRNFYEIESDRTDSLKLELKLEEFL